VEVDKDKERGERTKGREWKEGEGNERGRKGTWKTEHLIGKILHTLIMTLNCVLFDCTTRIGIGIAQFHFLQRYNLNSILTAVQARR